MNERLLVFYDIACDRRRARIARILLAYGERGLESVYECRIDNDPKIFTEIRNRIEKIAAVDDKIGYWKICGQDLKRRKSQGRTVFPKEEHYFIF